MDASPDHFLAYAIRDPHSRPARLELMYVTWSETPFMDELGLPSSQPCYSKVATALQCSTTQQAFTGSSHVIPEYPTLAPKHSPELSHELGIGRACPACGVPWEQAVGHILLRERMEAEFSWEPRRLLSMTYAGDGMGRNRIRLDSFIGSRNARAHSRRHLAACLRSREKRHPAIGCVNRRYSVHWRHRANGPVRIRRGGRLRVADMMNLPRMPSLQSTCAEKRNTLTVASR